MSLEKYKEKRNFKETPEPVGAKEKKADKLVFVIQRHKASHLHYDFRLEMEGVLKSWAVPKGPSLNPADKRLAMMVEDHPFDYKDFSGVIPEGNYGAGIVEIWDSGTYSDLEGNDKKTAEKILRAGLEAGNLKVKLNGKKLKGEFALVKLKGREENSWLLLKHKDKYAVTEPYNSEEDTPKNSPINKWLAEHGTPKRRGRTKSAKVEAPEVEKVQPEKAATKGEAKKPALATQQFEEKGRKLNDFIPAMLAKETDKPFNSNDWIFEIKWDGYRAIAEVEEGNVKLYSRNGNSFLANYPAVVEQLQQLQHNAVLDGEIVVMDEDGKPNFQKLQHYEENRHLPLLYYVFDLLELNGQQTYDLPLIQRKELLKEVVGDNPVIKFSDHVVETGEDFFEVAKDKNLEGIMAKKADSKYLPGKRTTDWLKIKQHKSDEAIICGFTAPRGGRKYFGALVLGVMEVGKLKYIGHTGSGFDEKLLKELWNKLEPLIQKESPFEERIKTNMPVTWVTPKYVCELKFTEWTNDGKLRHPIFLRLREDKSVAEVNGAEETPAPKTEIKIKRAAPKKSRANSKEDLEPEKPAQTIKKAAKKVIALAKETKVKKAPAKEVKAKEPTKATPAKKAAKKAKEEPTIQLVGDVVDNPKEKTYKLGKVEVKTTNRTKVFFPDEGYTKGDVLDYYDRMADYILPYLKDRPESLFRTPNGINKGGFFHKDAAEDAPDFVDRIVLHSDSAKKDIDYIICNNKATLLYMANLGCIEINPWHSTTQDLDNPDYLIIDIDPSEKNTFEDVIEAANVVKSILDKAGANSICKTSGATGLHIYVPTGKQYSYDQVKDFAYLICMMANAQLPATTTLERSLSKRKKDQIYMDYLQNRKGQTIASVYSLRPKPGATVSTPLLWKEVKPGLNPRDFNINTIEARLKKMGDIFGDVLKKPIDLLKCIENLEQ